MIPLYDCVICGTHEYEHVYFWNMYGDELCDYQMQICWFMIIDVLGGATGIEPVTIQWHPTRGTGRWLPPLLA
jgi:hypothetical protein